MLIILISQFSKGSYCLYREMSLATISKNLLQSEINYKIFILHKLAITIYNIRKAVKFSKYHSTWDCLDGFESWILHLGIKACVFIVFIELDYLR